MQEETRKASGPGHSLGESKRLSLKEISALCREGSEAGRMTSRDMNRVCGRCLVDDNWLWGFCKVIICCYSEDAYSMHRV